MTSPTLKTFLVAIEQSIIHSTFVKAPDEATARRQATDEYMPAEKLGKFEPRSGWQLTFLEWQYADVAEVQP